jgi:hypothetical protein
MTLKQLSSTPIAQCPDLQEVFTLLFSILFYPCFLLAQDTSWTLADKQALIENYHRTQKEINTETAKLSAAQWAYKEKPENWNIGQVLEHLNMWQLITLYNARNIYDGGAKPELAKFAGTDSANVLFIYEQQNHQSPEFTIPTGFIPGVKNLEVFNFHCNKILAGIEKTEGNFKVFLRGNKETWLENLYQTYAIQFGHVDRHLRQIKRIKSDKNFPKK